MDTMNQLMTPATITELLDRLEAAEKDIALKERIIDSLGSELNAVANERDDLLARIREMERQEPVAWLHETRRDSDVVTDAVKHVWGKAVVGSLAAYSIPLYLAPGAQPAQGEEARLVSYHPDGDTCTLNINGVEMYYDRVDRDTQPAPSVPCGWIQRGMAELAAIRNRLDDDTLLDDRTLIERIGSAMLAAPEAKP